MKREKKPSADPPRSGITALQAEEIMRQAGASYAQGRRNKAGRPGEE